jgi:hypothetical protein
MWGRRHLAWATVGLIFLAPSAAALADKPAREFRFFETDLRTICECVYRAEYDFGLSESGTPNWSESTKVGVYLREGTICVVPPGD